MNRDYDITNYSERPAPKVEAKPILPPMKRVRKPLTPEQRLRKQERDRAYRARQKYAKEQAAPTTQF